jgi:ribonuclease HI
MQDPATRVYNPQYYWGNAFDPDHHTSYGSGRDFVRAQCDFHILCRCSGFYELIELKQCYEDGRCLIYCGNFYAHGHAIVIATDGVCRNEGRPDAVAACGVFFNIDSNHNKAFKVTEERPTSQRAKLHAALYALNAFTKMVTFGNILRRHLITEVIIKSDSASLVDGMTRLIAAWRQNGYRNAHGENLNNKNLFRKLDRVCNDLERLNIRARFWLVPREENRQADKLASAALDGTPWRDWKNVNDWFGNDASRPEIHQGLRI